MSLTLPPELERFVEQELASGRFSTAEEMICAGLRLLRDRERQLEELRQAIDLGLEQVQRGEVTPIEDQAAEDAFFEGIMKRGRERMNAGKKGT